MYRVWLSREKWIQCGITLKKSKERKSLRWDTIQNKVRLLVQELSSLVVLNTITLLAVVFGPSRAKHIRTVVRSILYYEVSIANQIPQGSQQCRILRLSRSTTQPKDSSPPMSWAAPICYLACMLLPVGLPTGAYEIFTCEKISEFVNAMLSTWLFLLIFSLTKLGVKFLPIS